MRINYWLSFIGIAAMILFVSCNDVFEEDIEGDTIQLIAPSDQLSYEDFLQNFWWKKVEGATSYHFQLVEGTFDQPVQILADSNVRTEKFQFSLSPGSFQWRVKAFNNGYETKYTVRNLTINDAPIDQQVVNIKSPLDGQTFYSKTVSFAWDNLHGANRYLLEADTITGNFSSSRYRDTIDAASGNEQVILRNIPVVSGSFQWRIAGISQDQSKSKFSNVGQFVISTAAPVLIVPAATTSPVELGWRAVKGIDDYLLIVRDSTQRTIQEESLNGVQKFSFVVPSGLRKFSWAVQGKDKAGTLSPIAEFQNVELK